MRRTYTSQSSATIPPYPLHTSALPVRHTHSSLAPSLRQATPIHVNPDLRDIPTQSQPVATSPAKSNRLNATSQAESALAKRDTPSPVTPARCDVPSQFRPAQSVATTHSRPARQSTPVQPFATNRPRSSQINATYQLASSHVRPVHRDIPPHFDPSQTVATIHNPNRKTNHG
jgi:hypothetical protein